MAIVLSGFSSRTEKVVVFVVAVIFAWIVTQLVAPFLLVARELADPIVFVLMVWIFYRLILPRLP